MLPEAIQPVGCGSPRTARRPSSRSARRTASRWSNAETYEVEKYLLVGQRVWQLAFSPDEKLLFTTNGISNDVSVIDVETDEVVKSIPVGEQPWGVVAIELEQAREEAT